MLKSKIDLLEFNIVENKFQKFIEYIHLIIIIEIEYKMFENHFVENTNLIISTYNIYEFELISNASLSIIFFCTYYNDLIPSPNDDKYNNISFVLMYHFA